MKIKALGIVQYLIYCYLFLAFTLVFIILYGGGGHGPFVPVYWLFIYIFCLASFPASLISICGFAVANDAEIVILLLALSPILNAGVISLFLQFRKNIKKRKNINIQETNPPGQRSAGR